MKKLLHVVLLIVGVGLMLRGIFGLERGSRESRKENLENELNLDLPWVRQCAGPPPPYQVATNETGGYALIMDGIGVLEGSISPTRQGSINFGWQYVMYCADKAAKPKPNPEVWVKSE